MSKALNLRVGELLYGTIYGLEFKTQAQGLEREFQGFKVSDLEFEV